MGYYNCAQVAGFVVLLLGTAAIIVSTVTNFWLVMPTGTAHSGLIYNCLNGKGVILNVHDSDTICANRFSGLYDNVKKEVDGQDFDALFKNTDVRSWQFAVLLLMVVAGALGVVAIATAPCCRNCSCCQGCLVLWSAIMSAAGIIVYVYYTEQAKHQVIEAFGTELSVDVPKPKYSWSFFVAIIGAALQTFASLTFCVGGSVVTRSRTYTHQI